MFRSITGIGALTIALLTTPTTWAQDDLFAESVSGVADYHAEAANQLKARIAELQAETSQLRQMLESLGEGARVPQDPAIDADRAAHSAQITERMKVVEQTLADRQAALLELRTIVAEAAAEQENLAVLLDSVENKPSSWRIGVALAAPTATTSGLTIKDVLAKSPAEKAGLKAGDYIVECSKIRLRSADDLRTLLQVIRDQPITLDVVRKGAGGIAPIEVELTPTDEEPWNQKPPVVVSGTVTPGPDGPSIVFTPSTDGNLATSQAAQATERRLDKMESRLERIEELLEAMIQKRNE